MIGHQIRDIMLVVHLWLLAFASAVFIKAILIGLQGFRACANICWNTLSNTGALPTQLSTRH